MYGGIRSTCLRRRLKNTGHTLKDSLTFDSDSSLQNVWAKNGAYSTLLEDFWKVDLYLGKMFATKQNKNARSAIFTWLNVVSQKIFEKKNSKFVFDKYSKNYNNLRCLNFTSAPTWKRSSHLRNYVFTPTFGL